VPGDCLLVFVKSPRPGEAKTRLVPHIGAEGAADLYRALAAEEVRRTAPRTGEYERLFFFAPPDAEAEMRRWFPGERFVPQRGDDLGARMAAAFDEAFERGARRAVLIGSDVPRLSRDGVMEALRALEDHDLVLGPAHDGGYYLIALGRAQPALFRGIPWSSASVLAATAERAGSLGLAVRLLDPLRDIDTLEDVRAEWPWLRRLLASRPQLVASVEAALASAG
jgi:rSAM/selenodomain-associated transferase 1